MTGIPTRLFINGELVRSTGGESIPQINPATEEFLAEVSAASLADAHTAVKGAHKAYTDAWGRASSPTRSGVLFAVAAGIRERSETLARLETRNTGKPISDTRREIEFGARAFEYYAGAIDKFFGQSVPGEGGLHLTLRESMGVVAIIVAWNYPFLQACLKCAPALAAGNAVVLKPASRSPLTAILLGQLAHEAGLHPGLLQVLPGSGGEIGEALVSHPLVRKITFSGSSEIGSRLMVRAARDLKRVALELGGRAPCIVCADADVESVAPVAALSAFANAGQNANAASRLLVESTVYDRFATRFVEATRALKLGNPMKKETQIGPLISGEQRELVEHFIDSTRRAGRVVPVGGLRPFEKGFFLEPTVVLDAERTDAVWNEEIFGPICCLRAFDDEEELLEVINDSVYGTHATIWTQNLPRAMRIARGIQGGSVSINADAAPRLEAPAGGIKHSGMGRHLGMAGLEEYTELKSIFIGE